MNVVAGVRSFYRWQGNVEDDAEVQLLIKTSRQRFDALERWLTANHPYDVPEIIALPVVAGSAAYLSWLHEQLG